MNPWIIRLLSCVTFAAACPLPVWGQAGLPSEEVQKRYPQFKEYYEVERHFEDGAGLPTLFGSEEVSTKLAHTFHGEMEKVRSQLAEKAGLTKEAVASTPMITYARHARGAYIYIIQPPEWNAYSSPQRMEFINASLRHANVTSFADGGSGSILFVAIRLRNNNNQIFQGRVLEQEDGAPKSVRRIDFHGGEILMSSFFAEGDLGIQGRTDEELRHQVIGNWRHHCFGTEIYAWYLPDGTYKVVYVNGKKLQWHGEATWRVEAGELVMHFLKEKSNIPGVAYGPGEEDFAKLIWLEDGPKGKMVTRGMKDWQTWVPRKADVPSYESYLEAAASAETAP